MPWPDREAELLHHLDEKPFLLVLDGLERILLAYHRMDASYLADDKYDEQAANYVVGATGLPASAAKTFVGQHRLRQSDWDCCSQPTKRFPQPCQNGQGSGAKECADCA